MSTIYSPQLTSPKGGEVFNLGTVTIEWDRNDPPSDDPYLDNAAITYEIEYCEEYNGSKTVWSTAKKRIPWTETSYDWKVGKQIKSNDVRLRIRARNRTNSETSDWSMIGGSISINVFKLIPPAIVNPLPQHTYTDFVLIILDESLTRTTFNQKIRYTLEYSSEKLSTGWQTIVRDVPYGQNVIRWSLDDVVPSDDYTLRLTAKNSSTSCLETTTSQPDQIAKRFVYNLKLQQPGMFLIDTRPPQAILNIEQTNGITNQIVQTVDVFAEDNTSTVEKIQLRECEASKTFPLGDITKLSSSNSDPECPSISDIISGQDVDFNRLIGKPSSYAAKTQWIFENVSGLRKLEAILTDSGGNTSIQDPNKTFIPMFKSDYTINDIIIITEQRDAIEVNISQSESCNEAAIETNAAEYEVAYLVDNNGQYWILEPFPRLLNTLAIKDIKKITSFNDTNYLFPYDTDSDEGYVYRDTGTTLDSVFNFPNSLSIVQAVAEYENVLYIGLTNGELWSFDAVSFSLIKTFSNAINSLAADEQFLYIGLKNSSLVTLYNSVEFFSSNLDP